jgi:hypothetical protein
MVVCASRTATASHWLGLRARRGASALAQTWFDTGVSVVIIEGECFDRQQLSELTTHIKPYIVRHFVTLNLSYAHALVRVQDDSSRGASKDPHFLHSLHTDFAHALSYLQAASVVIDTDNFAQHDVVARLLPLVEA